MDSQNSKSGANDQPWAERGLLQHRRNSLHVGLREAETKYRDAKALLRQWRTKINEIRARLVEVQQIEELMIARKSTEGQIIVGGRVSEIIIAILEQCDSPAGLTIAEISEGLSMKRQHISATLYNLKKRGIVNHSEATGRYNLVRNTANPPYIDSHASAQNLADMLRVLDDEQQRDLQRDAAKPR